MRDKVLVIESSMIPIEKSFSRTLTREFVNLYRKYYSDDEFTFLNLNEIPMAQKTMNSKNFSGFFNKEDSDVYIDQLKLTNKVILSTPMTNFNYPAVLKNYIDHIMVADKTFSYKYKHKDGSVGLLNHLKVQILATQGAPIGWYPFANHVENLMGAWNFIGAHVYKPIVLDGTKVTYSTLSPTEVVRKFFTQIEEAVKKFH